MLHKLRQSQRLNSTQQYKQHKKNKKSHWLKFPMLAPSRSENTNQRRYQQLFKTVGYLLELGCRVGEHYHCCAHRSSHCSLFQAMDTFFGPYFHFCLELAFFWVHNLNHTHSLASFRWSVLSRQQMLLLTENCLSGEAVSCTNKVRNGPSNAKQGCLKPAKNSSHVHNIPC